MMRTKTTELWKSGSFAEGDWAITSIKRGSIYVTLYYVTRIQGDRCCEWQWPLKEEDRLMAAVARFDGWLEAIVNAMPEPAKYKRSHPIR
jgi:hypothetical protein